jgi:hypothetical protein
MTATSTFAKKGVFGLSSGDGARRCAEQIGALSAKYLKKRIGR